MVFFDDGESWIDGRGGSSPTAAGAIGGMSSGRGWRSEIGRADEIEVCHGHRSTVLSLNLTGSSMRGKLDIYRLMRQWKKRAKAEREGQNQKGVGRWDVSDEEKRQPCPQRGKCGRCSGRRKFGGALKKKNNHWEEELSLP